MKKYFLLSLVLLVIGKVEAQKKLTLQKPSDFHRQSLSVEKQDQLQKLRNSDHFISVEVIEVGDIKTQVKKGELSFDLPGKLGWLDATTKALDYQSGSGFIWIGEMNNGEVLLTHENGRTFGQIRKDGRVFDIQYLEDGYATMIEYDMEKLNPLGCAARELVGSPKGVETVPLDQPGISEKSGSITRSSGSPLIRVLCLYTPAAEATGMNMTDLANTSKSQWLSAQLNSWVGSNLEIAGVERLNFTENGVPESQTGDPGEDIDVDVERLRDNTTAQQLRDQYEADLVVMFTDGDYAENGSGLAGTVLNIGPDEGNAYSLVQVANATSSFTWIHEVGHLFGARHQFAADDTPGDAHGHQWTTGVWPFRNRYRSVMHTFVANRERVLHFSNPNRNHAGKATGVSGESYNARVISTNGSQVEDFRYTRPNVAVNIYGVGMANDGDPVNLTSSVSNVSGSVSYQWRLDMGGGFYTAGVSSTLNFTMPTDEDVDVRLTVTDSEGRTDTDIHFVRNSFLNGGPCTICPDSTTYDFAEVSGEMNELEEAESLLYPNPTSDFIELIIEERMSSESDRIQIIDLKGAIQSQRTITLAEANKGSIIENVTGLREGIYLVKYIGEHHKQTFRFVKGQ